MLKILTRSAGDVLLQPGHGVLRVVLAWAQAHCQAEHEQTNWNNKQSVGREGESLSVWTTSDSAHAGAWLNTDVDGWFVYVLYWVCNSYKHWQIWRAGSHSEPSALDARRNVVTFITNISPHLQELTVRWSHQTSGSDHGQNTIRTPHNILTFH